MTAKTPILIAVLALSSPWAGAQTVWRCGNSYSQQPCAGGSAVATSESPRATHAAATRTPNPDAKLAAEMEKARLEQERNAPKALVIGPKDPPAHAEPAKNKTKAKTGKEEQFTAVSPGQPKKPKAKKKSA